MKLSSQQENLWELDIDLNAGGVKFRVGDNWAQNWGGNSFPNGKGIADGENIAIVEPGFYHIELNLSKWEYKFDKIEKP